MSAATQEDVQDSTRRSIGRGSTISGSAIGAMFGLGGREYLLVRDGDVNYGRGQPFTGSSN
jgi:hypothetical protein